MLAEFIFVRGARGGSGTLPPLARTSAAPFSPSPSALRGLPAFWGPRSPPPVVSGRGKPPHPAPGAEHKGLVGSGSGEAARSHRPGAERGLAGTLGAVFLSQSPVLPPALSPGGGFAFIRGWAHRPPFPAQLRMENWQEERRGSCLWGGLRTPSLHAHGLPARPLPRGRRTRPPSPPSPIVGPSAPAAAAAFPVSPHQGDLTLQHSNVSSHQ